MTSFLRGLIGGVSKEGNATTTSPDSTSDIPELPASIAQILANARGDKPLFDHILLIASHSFAAATLAIGGAFDPSTSHDDDDHQNEKKPQNLIEGDLSAIVSICAELIGMAGTSMGASDDVLKNALGAVNLCSALIAEEKLTSPNTIEAVVAASSGLLLRVAPTSLLAAAAARLLYLLAAHDDPDVRVLVLTSVQSARCLTCVVESALSVEQDQQREAALHSQSSSGTGTPNEEAATFVKVRANVTASTPSADSYLVEEGVAAPGAAGPDLWVSLLMSLLAAATEAGEDAVEQAVDAFFAADDTRAHALFEHLSTTLAEAPEDLESLLLLDMALGTSPAFRKSVYELSSPEALAMKTPLAGGHTLSSLVVREGGQLGTLLKVVEAILEPKSDHTSDFLAEISVAFDEKLPSPFTSQSLSSEEVRAICLSSVGNVLSWAAADRNTCLAICDPEELVESADGATTSAQDVLLICLCDCLCGLSDSDPLTRQAFESALMRLAPFITNVAFATAKEIVGFCDVNASDAPTARPTLERLIEIVFSQAYASNRSLAIACALAAHVEWASPVIVAVVAETRRWLTFSAGDSGENVSTESLSTAVEALVDEGSDISTLIPHSLHGLPSLKDQYFNVLQMGGSGPPEEGESLVTDGNSCFGPAHAAARQLCFALNLHDDPEARAAERENADIQDPEMLDLYSEYVQQLLSRAADGSAGGLGLFVLRYLAGKFDRLIDEKGALDNAAEEDNIAAVEQAEKNAEEVLEQAAAAPPSSEGLLGGLLSLAFGRRAPQVSKPQTEEADFDDGCGGVLVEAGLEAWVVELADADTSLAADIAELSAAREKTVAEEDLDSAEEIGQQIKETEAMLSQCLAIKTDIQTQLHALQAEKREAVAVEDFSRAKQIKEQLESLEKAMAKLETLCAP